MSLETRLASIFASDAEATNFSAHVGWSLAFPLAGHAIGDGVGLFIVGGLWLAYSLVNEFALHGPEGGRELRLNLISRLAPCASLFAFHAIEHR